MISKASIAPNLERTPPMPKVTLDQEYYKKIDMFLERFLKNPPSLLECSSMAVEGDVRFEENVRCVGDVRLINKSPVQAVVQAGTVLNGEYVF